MNNASVQIAVGDRLTIVDSIGTRGDHSNGQSLRGQNVNDYPDSALFWVRNSNRLYKLKKNQAIAIAEDTTGFDNVVDGVGSNDVNGRFVATNQFCQALLAADEESGTSVTVGGFDLTSDGSWLMTHQGVDGGTPGTLWAEIVNETTVKLHSTASTDTNLVFATFVEALNGE